MNDVTCDPRTATRRIPRILIASLVIVLAAIAAGLGYQLLASPSAAEADGAVPDGVTVFDDETPAVANLDPDLLRALRQAATDAAEDGVEILVKSGWRSPKYQEQLLHEAVSKYGSEKEAARWVATADTSFHVSGHAVDVGSSDATAWLSEHAGEYGLCQIYTNEPWHYELRPEAIHVGCPSMYADPRHDPRMRRPSRRFWAHPARWLPRFHEWRRRAVPIL